MLGLGTITGSTITGLDACLVSAVATVSSIDIANVMSSSKGHGGGRGSVWFYDHVYHGIGTINWSFKIEILKLYPHVPTVPCELLH